MKVSAIVMASGHSKRMKRDKLLMKLNNKEIFKYIVDTISEIDFDRKILVARKDLILSYGEEKGFTSVKNEKSFKGQSESIKLGVTNSGEVDGYMFFVADQPFIKCETIDKLLDTFEKNPSNIIIPFYNNIKGNPIIFPSFLKEELLNIEEDKGGSAVIKNNIDIIKKVFIDTDYENIDIDTKEAYEKIRSNVYG